VRDEILDLLKFTSHYVYDKKCYNANKCFEDEADVWEKIQPEIDNGIPPDFTEYYSELEMKACEDTCAAEYKRCSECKSADKSECELELAAAAKNGKVLFRKVEDDGSIKYEKHPADKIEEKEGQGLMMTTSCENLDYEGSEFSECVHPDCACYPAGPA